MTYNSYNGQNLNLGFPTASCISVNHDGEYRVLVLLSGGKPTMVPPFS